MDTSKIKEVWLDRDRTLVGAITRSPYPSIIKGICDMTPIPSAIRAISELPKNIPVYVLTNQGGVEKGHKSISDVKVEGDWLLQTFPTIDIVYSVIDFAGNTLIKSFRGVEDMIGHELITKDQQSYSSFRKPDLGVFEQFSKCKFNEIMFVDDLESNMIKSKKAGIVSITAAQWWMLKEYDYDNED